MVSIFSKTMIVLSIFAVIGCEQPKKVGRQKMIAYINNAENDLIKKEEVNGIQVYVAFKPSSLLVLQELSDIQKKDSSIIRKLEEKYKNQYYFTLTISKNNKEVIRELGTFSRYSDMLQVFAFGMQEHINLTTTRNDTIPVADYFFDQSYGTSNGNNILISFNRSKIDGRKDIYINLAECGLGIGNLKFHFSVPYMEQIPILDYSLD